MLFEKFGLPNDGRAWGVEAVFCVFRDGESGRGSDGRLAFMVGLGTRPGPTDLLKLGAMEGPGDAKEVFSCLPLLPYILVEDMVGVKGIESPEDGAGDKRL